MCTVAFAPRLAGYVLTMNRDEQLSRPAGLPPRLHRVGERRALFPSEPGGGTWIGVNDTGASFALINWYSVRHRARGPAVSRGEVVKRVLTAGSREVTDGLLARCPLESVNPFRLIGIFPASQCIVEWRWDLEQLDRRQHRWRVTAWFSSGFDEAGAQKNRGRAFREALQQTSSGRLDWLRRLHRSHQPKRGPYSICMHRADATTVSYTEIVLGRNSAVMRYRPGTPCRGRPFQVWSLPQRLKM